MTGYIETGAEEVRQGYREKGVRVEDTKLLAAGCPWIFCMKTYAIYLRKSGSCKPSS